MSKRISRAKRQHLIRCAVALQPWHIDSEAEAARLCDAALSDLSTPPPWYAAGIDAPRRDDAMEFRCE